MSNSSLPDPGEIFEANRTLGGRKRRFFRFDGITIKFIFDGERSYRRSLEEILEEVRATAREIEDSYPTIPDEIIRVKERAEHGGDCLVLLRGESLVLQHEEKVTGRLDYSVLPFSPRYFYCLGQVQRGVEQFKPSPQAASYPSHTLKALTRHLSSFAYSRDTSAAYWVQLLLATNDCPSMRLRIDQDSQVEHWEEWLWEDEINHRG